MKADIRSATFAASALAVVLVITQFAQPASVPATAQLLPVGGPVRVVIDGHPTAKALVEVRATTSQPYVVPMGKRFLLAGLGTSGNLGATVRLYLDGQLEGLLALPVSQTFGEVAPLRPIAEGTSIALDNSAGPATSARAWGYLVDA